MTITIKTEHCATREKALPPSQTYLLERALDSTFTIHDSKIQTKLRLLA